MENDGDDDGESIVSETRTIWYDQEEIDEDSGQKWQMVSRYGRKKM